MDVAQLDYVLVILGLTVYGVYHSWLAFTIMRNPRHTVIGLNAESRTQWLFSLMADPLKNGALFVQIIQNDMMSPAELAATVITLGSFMGIMRYNSTVTNASFKLGVHGDKSEIVLSIKLFSFIICLLVGILLILQSNRYYRQVCFSATSPTGKKEDAAQSLNRASFFSSFGWRAFYFSISISVWIIGPIPMFAYCCILSFVLYFLDTTSSFTRQVQSESFEENDNDGMVTPEVV